VNNDQPSRRAVLAGAGGVAAGAVLSGCAVYGKKKEAASAQGGNAGAVLAQTTDIPVGGGKVIDAAGVVLTQPQQGTFKAFSATCTHQGCIVSEVKDGTINCPCHGSKFKVADGTVANGPADKPLPAVTVTVDGTSIKRA
jgi:Rieske Fe-S protein